MATLCSTGFRRLILGPASFESIFNGGKIEIYAGTQPDSADGYAGYVLAEITAAGGLRFQRSSHYACNEDGQDWTLNGTLTGTATWGRLLPAQADDGDISTTAPRIDFAVGLDDDSPGDYQMRLPTTAIVPGTTIVVASWWFVLPPI